MIVTGTAATTEGSGWWKHQYSGAGKPGISADTAAGYVEIVNAVSSVFSENVTAATAGDVHSILSAPDADRRARAIAALMEAWLQFASGGVAVNASVQLSGGSHISFLDLMSESESTILDADARRPPCWPSSRTSRGCATPADHSSSSARRP